MHWPLAHRRGMLRLPEDGSLHEQGECMKPPSAPSAAGCMHDAWCMHALYMHVCGCTSVHPLCGAPRSSHTCMHLDLHIRACTSIFTSIFTWRFAPPARSRARLPVCVRYDPRMRGAPWCMHGARPPVCVHAWTLPSLHATSDPHMPIPPPPPHCRTSTIACGTATTQRIARWSSITRRR